MYKKILLILLIAFSFNGLICFARPSSTPARTTPDSIIPVKVSLVIDKLEKVDSLKQTFTLHGNLTTKWADTRLKNHVCTAPMSSKKTCIYTQHLSDIALDKIWHPDLRITNASDKVEYGNQKLTIFNTGKAVHEMQFNADIHSILNLKNMPFDKQSLFINLESFSWDYRHLLLQIDEIVFHDKASRFIHGWNVNHYSHRCTLDEEPREHKSFYKCTIKLDIKHIPHYFIVRFIAPTFLFVLISWLSFIATPNDRMRLSLSCLFMLIIYELYIASKIPNIYYVTKVDLFFILGIISICLLILYHAVEAKRSRDQEKKENKQISYIPRPLPLYWRVLIIGGYFVAALLIILL